SSRWPSMSGRRLVETVESSWVVRGVFMAGFEYEVGLFGGFQDVGEEIAEFVFVETVDQAGRHWRFWRGLNVLNVGAGDFAGLGEVERADRDDEIVVTLFEDFSGLSGAVFQ